MCTQIYVIQQRAKRFVKRVYQDSLDKHNWLMEDKTTGIVQLQTHLPWHKARIKFLSMLTLSYVPERLLTATMLWY